MPETKTIELPSAGIDGAESLAGLALAAFGLMPPLRAAASQSIPDLGMLANSSRLLRQQVLLPAAPTPSPTAQRAVPMPLMPVSQGGAQAGEACGCCTPAGEPIAGQPLVECGG